MTHIWRTIKRYLLEIWNVILTIIFVFVLPTIVVLLSPIFLYRYCLGLYVKHCRPDLGKILACGNATMASYDDIYGDTRNTTVISVKVKGAVNIEEARSLVSQRLIESREKEGALKYPELQQYPVKFGGYFIWKPVDEVFNVANHVNYYTLPEQGKVYDDEEASQIEAELGTKRHTPFRSPWEFVILPNVKSHPADLEPEDSIVFFRTHHCITDGFGIYNLLFVELCCKDGQLENDAKIANPQFFHRNIFMKILSCLTLLVRIPYDILHIPTMATGKTDSGFRVGKNLSAENHAVNAPLIQSIKVFKDIRKLHNVSFSAVVAAAFIGGLRRMMLQRERKIPTSMGFCCPVPLPDHPFTKLRIHASIVNLLLPIGVKDPEKRLKAIEKEIQDAKKSTVALGMFLIAPIIGSLPPYLIDLCFPGSMVSGCINNFPGPPTTKVMFNKEILSIHFTQGQSKLLIGLIFTALTYKKEVILKTTVNKAIFRDKSDIKLLTNFILEELESLQKQQVKTILDFIGENNYQSV